MAATWDDVFDAALRRVDVIAVTAVVADHLQHTPTRAELSGAQRAAHSYASGSNVQLLKISPGTGGRVLLLDRADADLSDPNRLRDIAAQREPTGPLRGRGPRTVEQRTENLLRETARWARQIDVGQIDPGHARSLARDLDDNLSDLRRLRQRLQARARSAHPER